MATPVGKNLRILIVSNLYPPDIQGGYEILCEQVVEWLRGRQHEVSVLTTGPGQLQLLGPFPQPPPRTRRAQMRLMRHNQGVTERAIAKLRPEVIFMWSQLRLGSGPARAAEASGYPVLYTWNDDHILGLAPVPWGLSPRRLAGAISDRTWARATTWSGLRFAHALSISHKLSEGLRSGGYGGPLRVIYQGIRLDEFPCKANPGAISRPPRLLYVGQLHPYKGVHTVLEALKLCPDWHLTIVGAGSPDYQQSLLQAAAELGPRVEFLGKQPRDQLSQIYRQHDAFVFPSIWVEPYGLTHLEAMASGLPLLATMHGGHGEHLRSGINCLGFTKESPPQLAEALNQLQSDPELARRLALAGRAMVEMDLNFERYAREVEEALWQTLTP